MAEDSYGFASKAFVWKNLIQRFPKTSTSREIAIQIQRLERMAEAFDKKFPPAMILAVPPKKLKKAKGRDMHQLDKQAQRVDALVAQLIVETVVQDLGDNLPARARKQLPEHARRYVRQTNRVIYQQSQKVLKDAMKGALAALAGPAKAGKG